MYARARLPAAPASRATVWAEMSAGRSPHMHNALNWLNNHLAPIHAAGHKYLVANRLTAADIAMLFSIQLIYDRKLGLEGLPDGGRGKWAEVEKWRAYLEGEEESWARCVERTGFVMGGTL